uniref:RRM domain-containing protein n=1 Tax=Parascaris equorum TaxID=6256 RepID=A0A914S171_PAREQ
MRSINNVPVVCIQLLHASDEEAVRIFVEFTNVAQAIKAFVDLNGRYFGGRSIRASFYDLERYNANELDK